MCRRVCCVAVGHVTLSDAVNGYLVTNLGMAVTFTAVGGLVAGNRPRNLIGWLLLGHGACFALATLFGTIAISHATAFSDEDLRVLVALFMGLWPLGIGIALPLVIQLFPTGRPVGRRWRWLIVMTIVTGLAFVAQEHSLASCLAAKCRPCSVVPPPRRWTPCGRWCLPRWRACSR